VTGYRVGLAPEDVGVEVKLSEMEVEESSFAREGSYSGMSLCNLLVEPGCNAG
jgi:hypothetical protein